MFNFILERIVGVTCDNFNVIRGKSKRFVIVTWEKIMKIFVEQIIYNIFVQKGLKIYIKDLYKKILVS